MIAAARKPAARPSALEPTLPSNTFAPIGAKVSMRCEAKALAWKAGEIDLHDAVDSVQQLAEALGLVIELGHDAVQAIMVEIFAPLRDDLPRDDYDGSTFAAACDAADEKQRRKPSDPHLEKLRKLMGDDVSLERAHAKIKRTHFRDRAAGATVDALMRALRERGTSALTEPETRRRLAELSSKQVREVLARLMALRPDCPAIDDELLFLLGEQL